MTPWFKSFRLSSRPPRWRLFCLPYAGGSAGVFRHWPAFLPAGVELIAVQYPGREDRLREPPLTCLMALASAIAGEVEALGDARYAVFGHSLGALVSFELTRELRRRGGRLPEMLFVAAAGGPRINIHRKNPRSGWPDAEFVEELRSMGGTPEELLSNTELMRLMLPALRADLGAVDHYDYYEAPPLPLPLRAFGGLDDHDVRSERLSKWSEQTSVDFVMSMMAGDHFFLHDNAALLCGKIAEQMDGQEISSQRRARS